MRSRSRFVRADRGDRGAVGAWFALLSNAYSISDRINGADDVHFELHLLSANETSRRLAFRTCRFRFRLLSSSQWFVSLAHFRNGQLCQLNV